MVLNYQKTKICLKELLQVSDNEEPLHSDSEKHLQKTRQVCKSAEQLSVILLVD